MIKIKNNNTPTDALVLDEVSVEIICNFERDSREWEVFKYRKEKKAND